MKPKEPILLLGVRPWESPLPIRSIPSISKNHRELQWFYRLDHHLTLLQSGSCHENLKPKGHILALDSTTSQPEGDPQRVCDTLLEECHRKGYHGIATFFPYTPHPSPLKQLTSLLDQRSKKEGLSYYTTEEYASFTQYAYLFLSTALSGGTLEGRFSQAIQRYTPSRIIMDLEPMGEDFLLPSPKGTGDKKTLEEIHAQIARDHPSVFFSRELCAKYFTHQNRENSMRFLLFDDQSTLKEKMLLAKQWKLQGISTTWSEALPYQLFS